jgi:hypothetical protein
VGTRAAWTEGVLAVALVALHVWVLIFALSNLLWPGDKTLPSNRGRAADSAWRTAMQ